MTETYDVIVVGGGAIGAACARELARTGRTVFVLDRGGTIGQAWQAAAGMLAPQVEAHRNDALFRLGLAAREHYAPLATTLRDTTGIDIGLWREGIVHIARSETEVAELRRKVAWQRQSGQQCEWLDQREVKAQWPWLATTFGAFWAPQDGALHPGRLVQALLADATRHGAVVAHDTVMCLERYDDRLNRVVGVAGRYTAQDVVIAAGAWSGQIDGMPHPVPVGPLRGQMAALPWPAGVPRGIIYSNDGYLMARGGEAIVGSTMEHAGFQAETTAAGVAAILTAATSLSPMLRGEPRRTWAGLRPVTPDGLPIVGAASDMRGLWYATGHGRNGILLAGLTGLLLTRLLAGEAVSEDATQCSDLAECSPARFA